MKTEKREIYKCEFCNKLYQIKSFCEKHELICKRRPDYLRACHSCRVLKKVEKTIYLDSPIGSSISRTVDILFCEEKKCYIYPPSVAAKGNAFKLIESNIEMPKECEFYFSIYE